MLAINELERYILHPGDEPKETVYEFWERKERRIEKIFRKGKVDLIKAIERLYEDEYPDDACHRICKILHSTVRASARRWSRNAQSSGIRLYADDFEEVFWKAILDMIWYDYHSGSDFWLYEHIMKKMHSNALDLIKWAKRDKRIHDYTAISIDEQLQIADQRTSNLENNVIDTVLIQQMMNDPSLNERERELLRYLYDYPEATLRNIADKLDLGHPQTASRLLEKVQKKLEKYRNV
jgi:DNA-binding CsgD family transcriptional regulator